MIDPSASCSLARLFEQHLRRTRRIRLLGAVVGVSYFASNPLDAGPNMSVVGGITMSLAIGGRPTAESTSAAAHSASG
jgi:hypothetical protein